MEFASDHVFVPQNEDEVIEVVEENALNVNLEEWRGSAVPAPSEEMGIKSEQERATGGFGGPPTGGCLSGEPPPTGGRAAGDSTVSRGLSLFSAAAAPPPPPEHNASEPPFVPMSGGTHFSFGAAPCAEAGRFGFLSNAAPAQPQQMASASAFRPPRHNTVTASLGRRAYRREVDTNVVKVDLGTLGGEVTVATGDPKFCSKCLACLNAESELTAVEAEAFKCLWVCEFCGEQNILEMVLEEKPSAQSVDYILEAASVATGGAEVDSSSSTLLLFVIDISGSMCISQEVEGSFKLKGDHSASTRRLRGHGDDQNQRLPNERRGITYISRMQAVQAAVEAQLQALAQSQPGSRVGLITFNNEVSVIGDGTKSALNVAGDRLHNRDELLQIASTFTVDSPISETKDTLAEKLFAIEETGPTALGPAMLTAIGMAQSNRGAKIILCTDGIANTGLGALDEISTPEERAEKEAFYRGIGELASESGVMIDVIGIQGDDCDLANLGAMAEASNGQVTLVDVANLHRNFAGIMENPLVATNIKLRMLLHQGLMFRNEPEAVMESGGSSVQKDIGNAAADTAVTFEFKPRPGTQESTRQFSKLPFQVQIRYTRLNGMRCIRVQTQSRTVTDDRLAAEQTLRMNVIGTHVQQQSHELTSRSKYYQTRMNMRAWGNVMSRNCHTVEQAEDYAMTVTALSAVDLELERAEEEELAVGNRHLLDNADSCSDDEERTQTRVQTRKATKSKVDSMSSTLNSLKHSSATYKKR